MKYLILSCLILVSCSKKSFELEEISEDVIKSHEGIEIDVKPLPKR